SQAKNIKWVDGFGTIIDPNVIIANTQRNISGSETGANLGMYLTLANYPKYIEFETTAYQIEIIYPKTAFGTAANRNVDVSIDGTVASTFSAYGASPTYNNKHIQALDGKHHVVRIENVGEFSSGIQGINAIRRI